MNAVNRTASVMFVDMVGSTKMLDEVGNAQFTEIRHRYDDQVRRALGRHGGTEIKGTGDGTLATFESAAEAVSAGIEIQQFSVLDRDAGNLSPALRVGISLGDCRFEDGDVFGVPVVIAARLCDRAAPGDILIADIVATIAAMTAELSTSEPIDLELKGLTDPVAARTVIWQTGSAGGLPLPPNLTFEVGFPFTGREAELAQIADAYERSLAGELQVVALVGEPGIGKTRLLGASAEALHERGATVMFGACDEHQSIAHQPISEWLDFVVEHLDASELESVLLDEVQALAVLSPALARRLASTSPSSVGQFEGERHELYRSVANWLRTMSAQRPLFLVVDDIQWATPGTADLLSSLARMPGLGRVVLVTTMRDTEATPNDAVADLFTQLHRTSRFTEIAVTGLDPATVESMMTTAAGRDLRPAERAAVRSITEDTSGNMLFVTEMVRNLLETDVIAADPDADEDADRLADIEVPSSVRSIVDQRVRRLGTDARPVLEVAAVLGARFDPILLSDVAEIDDDLLDGSLAKALDAHLLYERRLPTPHLEFSHAIVRHTIYGLINQRRRLQLHRTVARVLEAQIGESPDDRVLTVAYHVFESQDRDVESAVRVAVRAARFATSRLDHDTAAGWYVRAIDRADSARLPIPARIELQTELGVAMKRAGRAGFRDPLMRAAELAREIGDDVARRNALLETHRGVYSSAGEVNLELLAALESAIRDTPATDVRSRALLGAQVASELTWDADLDRKVGYAREAERQARSLGDPSVLARVLICVSDVIEIVDPPEDLIRRSSELLDLGRELNDNRSTFFGALDLATAAMAGGRADLAAEAIEIGYEMVERLGEPILETHLNPRKASLLIATGHFDEGVAVAQRGFEMRLDTKQPEALMVFAGHQFELLRHRGQLAAVEGILVDTVEQTPALRVYAAALGLLYCATDRVDQAAELWKELTAHGVAPLFEGVQNVAINAAVFAELAYQVGDPIAAGELLEWIEPRLEEFAFAGPAWRGPMTLYLAMVHATLGNHGQASDLFATSITACDERGLVPEATNARMHASAHLESTGDISGAIAYAEAALPSATELGMEGVISDATDLLRRNRVDERDETNTGGNS